MMNARLVHLHVVGSLDMGKPQQGKVTINRGTLVIAVRPKYSRREYALPLGKVAEMIVARVIKRELADQQAAKRARVRR